MAKTNGKDSFPLFKSLASGWSAGRGSAVEPAMGNTVTGGLEASGPGFLYRWDNNHDPVLITFFPEGTYQVAAGEKDNLLFIGAGRDGLSVHHSQLPSHVIKTSCSTFQQQLEEIMSDVRNCKGSELANHRDTLTTISAAQRLIALGHDAHSERSNGKKAIKVPAKNRFVAELHEWLALELENSVKLGDAASHFNKSPRQLIRVLKETTNAGFAEHLTMHRLILARTLLMRTDESILEVAKRSGFNSREQFIRSFSKALGWTPLQFRKTWNKTSLSNGDLGSLCQINGRKTVEWQALGQPHTSTTEGSQARPHTLVVANALHEIVELFSIDSAGKPTRAEVLDRGSMAFINRATENSCWLIRTSESSFERFFITPDQHALALVSPEMMK
ncbi:helix-turn-helix transcriptional regulator [Haloferula sp.]|uniref:helix-turn-helix transcriptional regulator n=1 Tax=Haloferula sp. TaxID=2497595 RepID=UPI00329FD1C7